MPSFKCVQYVKLDKKCSLYLRSEKLKDIKKNDNLKNK